MTDCGSAPGPATVPEKNPLGRSATLRKLDACEVSTTGGLHNLITALCDDVLIS